ncbi:MAG: peptidoglycan-binding protein [Clostridia bacterium]|nr:peptidoglycan-binding protein [Clostridia bacterium]
MKRVFLVFLVLLLAIGAARAEAVDWAQLSDEEITALLKAGQAELDRRSAEPEAADGASDASAPAAFIPLEKGSKGDEVKALQQRLVDLYWLSGSVDGDYGNKTKDAVQRFQAEAGLPETGIADEATQEKLFADDAPEAQMSVSCSSVVMGNYGQTSWYVNGQSFTLKGSQTRKLKTPWGTYVFDALGEYRQVD